MSDSYIIQSIALTNFMLHRKTTVAMASAIVLVCGANGSGKTQVLDALLLCMGYQTRRVRHTGAAGVVGRWGEEMSVSCCILNATKASGKRVFADAPVFGDLVAEMASFEIRVTAAREGGAFRFVVCADGREQEVRAKALRQAFQQLGVDPGNSLSFTGEGTVGGFVDESSKSKLELLLETTGLLEARDALSKALSVLKEHRSGDQMRVQRLTLEREHLQRMEQKQDLIRKAEDLDRQEEGLHLELAWCEQAAVAERVSAFQKEVESLDADLQELNRVVNEAEGARRQFQSDVEVLQGQIRAARKERAELDTTRATTATRLELQQGQERDLQDSIRENEEKLDRQAEDLADLDTQLAALDADLADADGVRAELAALRREKHELSTRLAVADFRVRYLPQGQFAGSDFLDHALLLLEHCRDNGIEGVEGPLIRGLDIEVPQKAGLVVDALGPDLFALVADSGERLRELWSAASDLWQVVEECPPVRVVVPKAGVSARTNGVWWRSIISPAEAWAEDALCTLLEHSEEFEAPVDLDRRVVRRHQVHCLSPPVSDEDKALSELPRLRERLQALIPAISAKESEVAELARKEQRKERLGTERQSRHREREALQLAQENARRKAGDLQDGIEKARASLVAIDKRRPEVTDRLQRLEDRLQDKEAEARTMLDRYVRSTNEQNGKRQEKRALAQRLAQEQASERELRKQAEELGEKPRNARRSSSKIEAELNGLRLMRKELDLAPMDTGQLERQRARVQALEEEVRDGRDHAQHLDEDIRGRHRELSQQLNHLISQLGTSMTQLLAPAVSSVRLAVENVLKPDSAGLSIQVERREGDTLNLESLSGGEKVLVVEALIFAFHLMVRSPLHAIDEFTQRLDMDFKAQALDMAFRTVEEATRETEGPFRPQFLLMCPDTIGVDFAPNGTFRHVVLAGVDGME